MFKTRQQRLEEFMDQEKISCVLISHQIDISWLTGFQASFGYWVQFRSGRKYLISDSRYMVAGQKAAEMSGATFVLYNKDTLGALFGAMKGEILVQPSMKLEEHTQWNQIFNSAELHMKDAFMRKLRRNKTQIELDKMRQAQKHVDEILPGFLSHILCDGITEEEATFKLEIALRHNGMYGLSFDPIVAFGANSALPHHHGGKTKLKPNMPVLIDCGVTYEGYCSDMTRNAYFGNVSDDYKNDYDTLLRAQELTLKRCMAGVKIQELAGYCREQMGDLSAFFTHSLGHGVGVEIHEYPNVSVRSEDVFEDGDVITIEPGLYREGKYGIRIEDILVINGSTPDILSTMSKELLVLSA